MSAEARFLDWLGSVGLPPVKFYPAADGRIHRFRVKSEKPGSKNGWCVLASDPIPHGAAGSWRTGDVYRWRDTEARPITRAERADLARRMRELHAARQHEQQRAWAEARARAGRLWRIARPASATHPYLITKGVQSWGLRQLGDRLVVPLRDAAGVLHSLEFIDPAGKKRFLSGGQLQGHYHAIGRPSDVLCIGEGYATCATAYEATGYAVAVALFADNLAPVARALRAKFPQIKLVLLADDDYATPGNPGMAKATRAAQLVGGWIARPDATLMGDDPCPAST